MSTRRSATWGRWLLLTRSPSDFVSPSCPIFMVRPTVSIRDVWWEEGCPQLLWCAANNCTPTQSDFNAIEFRLGGSSGGSVPQGAAERGRRKRLGKLPHWKWKPRLGPAASLGFGDRCVRKQFKPAAGRACIRGCLQYRRTARTARRSPAPERGRGRA